MYYGVYEHDTLKVEVRIWRLHGLPVHEEKNQDKQRNKPDNWKPNTTTKQGNASEKQDHPTQRQTKEKKKPRGQPSTRVYVFVREDVAVFPFPSIPNQPNQTIELYPPLKMLHPRPKPLHNLPYAPHLIKLDLQLINLPQYSAKPRNLGVGIVHRGRSAGGLYRCRGLGLLVEL